MSALGVLVIDDSATNRRALAEIFEATDDVKVCARASDGEEGLRKVAELRPDVITLDLEMPRLDGFGFLRLLMASTPTPVIVISSYAHKTDVFRALELGAFDFIAKPGPSPAEHQHFRASLLEKVRAVRLIRGSAGRAAAPPSRLPAPAGGEPRLVLAVAASTGGPPAIQQLLDALAGAPSTSVLVCQHMPPRFTQAFAERLDRRGSFRVKEAGDGDLVEAGWVYIAPGGRHLTAHARPGGLRLATPDAHVADKYVPGADRLFQSLAAAIGARAVGVVLTGMGSDGAAGTLAVSKAGGTVWAESEETAVIYGMPKEAIATGGVTRVLPLPQLGAALKELARGREQG